MQTYGLIAGVTSLEPTCLHYCAVVNTNSTYKGLCAKEINFIQILQIIFKIFWKRSVLSVKNNELIGPDDI